MKFYNLLFLCFFLVRAGLSAQEYSFFIETRIKVKLEKEEDQWQLKWKVEKDSTEAVRAKFIMIDFVSMEDGDLIIQHTKAKNLKDVYFVYSASIQDSENDGLYNSGAFLKGDLGVNSRLERQTLKIVFEDAMEYALLPGKEVMISLQLKVVLQGVADCEEPVFDFNKKTPYYSAAIIGGGLLISGTILQLRADKDFDRYKQRWTDGVPGSEAASIYEEGKSKNKAGKIMVASGLGILAVDATLYALRLKKHKNAEKIYNQYCKPLDVSVTFSPVNKVHPLDKASFQTRIGLTFNF